MKDEREVITRQTVTQRLMYEAKHEIIAAILSLVFILAGYGMISLVTSLATGTLQNVLRIMDVVVVVFCIVFCSVIPFARGVAHMRNIRRGAFLIAEDVLEDVQDDQFSLKQTVLWDNRVSIWNILIDKRAFNRSSYQHVFKFKSGKVFIANSAEYQNTRLEATAQFSMPGDIFYTVFYEDAPAKIILFYSSKVYTYKDQ